MRWIGVAAMAAMLATATAANAQVTYELRDSASGAYFTWNAPDFVPRAPDYWYTQVDFTPTTCNVCDLPVTPGYALRYYFTNFENIYVGTSNGLEGVAVPSGSLGGLGTFIPFYKYGSSFSLEHTTLTVSTTPIQSTPPPHPITPYTLAELSIQAYNKEPAQFGSFAPITGLTLAGSTGQNGFGATAFQNVFDKNQIVVAVRGTDTSNVYNLAYNIVSDASLASTFSSNTVIASNVSQLADFITEVHSQNSAAEIVLTGHSLGGALAQIVANAAHIDAVTFDAPGAALVQFDQNTIQSLKNIPDGIATPSLTTLSDVTTQITNFRLYGDQVSLAGAQFGSTVTVDNAFADIVIDGSLLPLGWFYDHSPSDIAGQLSDLCGHSGATSSCANLRQGAVGYNFTTAVAIPVGLSFEAGLYAGDAAMAAGQDLRADIDNFNQAVSAIYKNILVFSNQHLPWDPEPGYAYLFEIDPGSPFVSSVALPDLGPVAGWGLEFKDQFGWSDPIYSTGYFDFTSDVSSLFFVPLDADGNPIFNPNPFLMDIAFQSDGLVNARLQSIGTNAVPEPITLSIFATGLSGLFVARRRRPNHRKAA